jgi:signal transduction histidine kinase
MTQRRLADFIRGNMEAILQAWEAFARVIEPPALTMSDEELRDYARQMLLEFAADLDTPQSAQESAAKSKGLGKRGCGDSAAEIHAEARLRHGYSVVQLVSEYRALRSSVLALWLGEPGGGQASNLADVTRFNEAVDQAVAESVARYQHLVQRSQNLFLAILGHDLRNPLGTLVAATSCMMQANDIAPKYVLMATRMFSSAQRMSRLIDDLIDFTRTHLGPGIPVEARPGNLMAVCRQVTNELRTYHPERRIELSAPSVLNAFFDEGRIAQMLSNLIGNALQYGQEDAPVSVSVTDSDHHIFIAIHNRGPAIPPDRISGIFDPMVRVSTTSEAGDAESTSLGLGLFIAREIIYAHGGQVNVASNAEHGTTFSVTLPRRSKAPGG